MKPIEAKKQVRLGPARCMQLALTGMSFRMFRSGVTVAILALAVAFLVHMLAYGLIAKRTETRAYRELAGGRTMGEFLTRLAEPDTRAIVLEQLADDNADRLAEYRRWLGGGAATFKHARATAVIAAQAGRSLTALPVTEQSVLLGELTPYQLFDQLHDPQRFEQWRKRYDSLKLAPPLGDFQVFEHLIMQRYPALLATVRRIQQGHRRAIARIQAAYPNRSPTQLAADPPGDFLSTLRQAGYSFDAAKLPMLETFAHRAQDIQTIAQWLGHPQVRAAVARQTGIQLSHVGLANTLASVNDAAQAQWFAGVLRREGGPQRLTGERILNLARHHQRQRELQAAAGAGNPTQHTGGFFGLSMRTRWLIVLSFLVCVVGVANAMLMSVTERFTEIATMKCLGAMDLFVMMMFVFEAIIQGVVGGIIGIVLGIALALLRAFAQFGALSFESADAVGEVALATGVSLVIGILLAAVAAVGPSWVAARLAPMEAMRVE